MKKDRVSKSNSFRHFCLFDPLLRAIVKKGYQKPTPVQKKCIPSLLDGKDVIASARTGSGKTLSYVIPLIQRLKCHNIKVGIRALVIAPTRELALQISSCIKDLSKFTDLRTECIIGGVDLDKQLAELIKNPDIMVSTPGRFLHIYQESKPKICLSTIEYFVLDEADILFEMGFYDQISQIIELLPEKRQNVLISATMPKEIIKFAEKTFKNAQHMNLDSENQLVDTLKTLNFYIRSDNRDAFLLYLLQSHIYTSTSPIMQQKPRTIIFAATRYHVEYLHEMLRAFQYKCSSIYGTMHQDARVLSLEKFKSHSSFILVVTDVAARGLDIPQVEYIINFDFPSTTKLYIHRVGRSARMGADGTAISIVCPKDLPYYIGLENSLRTKNSDFCIGEAPLNAFYEDQELITRVKRTNGPLLALFNVCENARKQYNKTRPKPDHELVKSAKHLDIKTHSMFFEKDASNNSDFLAALRSYKPRHTIKL